MRHIRLAKAAIVAAVRAAASFAIIGTGEMQDETVAVKDWRAIERDRAVLQDLNLLNAAFAQQRHQPATNGNRAINNKIHRISPMNVPKTSLRPGIEAALTYRRSDGIEVEGSEGDSYVLYFR